MNVRVGTLSQPAAVFNDKMLDWGICGLAGVAATASVLIYRATKHDLKYLQTIELGPKENVVCLKFHPMRTVLAIASESGIVFWDGETNEKSFNLKMENITALEWKDDFLVILRKEKHVHVFDFETKKLVWKVDLELKCRTIAIDPFSPFRVLFACSKETGFIVLESPDVRTQPNDKGELNYITIPDHLVNCTFHPQARDLIIIVCSSKIIMYELHTKSVKVIISNESSATTFISVAVSPFDVRSLHVLHSDATVSVFKWDGTVYLKKKDLKFVRELSSDCSICASKLFQHYYICYSPKNGLNLLRSGSTKTFVIKTASFVPFNYTCFDCIDNLVCLGTATGEICVIDCESAEVTCKFFIHESGIISVRFQNRDTVHFMGEIITGTVNIKDRIVKRYDPKSGPAIRLYASDEIAVLVHGPSVIGIINGGVETPIILDCKIWLLTPQIGRTPATCFRGDNPNIAVVPSSKRELLIYSTRSSKPVLNIRLPHEIECITALAWNGDKLVVADQSGFIFIHDFDFGNSKSISATTGIRSVAFTKSDLLFLSRNGDLCLYKGQKWDKCPINVARFRVTNSGSILFQGQNPILRLIKTDWKSACTVRQTIPSSTERLKSASRQILNLEGKTLKKISDVFVHAGFLFEAAVVRIVDRFLGGQKLPMKYAMFGGVEEAKYRNDFLVNMVDGSSLKVSLFTAGLHAINHDMTRVSQAFLNMNHTEESYVLAALAGSLLSQEALTESAKQKMKLIAISMFTTVPSSDLPFILLVLCGFETTAVQYLQDLGMWDRSMEILKSLPLDDTTKPYIRKCAYHYYTEEKYEMACLLFASIGDFHPLLCILITIDKPCLAFHLMMYLDSIDAISELKDDVYNTFYELELVRQQIIQKSEPYLT